MKDGKPARDVVTVTHRHTDDRAASRCIAVDDRLYLHGVLEERTTDWYAQDVEGNVWYFGEDTAELDATGRVTSREGTWQAGVARRPGGHLHAGAAAGRAVVPQEYYKGHAEDHFRVLSLSASRRVPYASSRHALLTKEWTPLEPGVIDHKLYVRGNGMVEERTVKGGDERWRAGRFGADKLRPWPRSAILYCPV